MSIRYVGPFFYIDGKIKALKVDVNKGEKIGAFINHRWSHFSFFNSFNTDPDDDYGYHPRGRVMYSIKRKIFIIYIDRDLDKDDIKQMILETYGLINEKVVFKRDSHYTHERVWNV